MRQGHLPVAENTEEFQDLACCLDWLEDILVSCFKDRLNDDLYHACITRGALNHLHNWHILTEEAEIRQAEDQYHSGRVW